MLAKAFNAHLYSDWLAYVSAIPTKEALCYLIGVAACRTDLICHPQFKGVNGPVREFQFLDQAKALRFAFIINRASLLFYFRRPAVSSGMYELRKLQAVFPTTSPDNYGQWRVRIVSLEDARKLAQFIAPARAHET